MDIQNIYLIASTLSLLVMAYFTVREARERKKKSESERDVNVTAAVNNLSSALGMTTDELVERIAEAAKLRDELNAQKQATQQRVDETTRHRAEMESKIEALNRDYAAETQKLRDEVEILRKQVADGEKKYNAAKLIIEKLVAALRKENIELPNLDLSDLSDSIRGWKWPEK